MFSPNDIDNYFNAFRHVQVFLMLLGGVALLLACIFYIGLKTQWYKGFALPMAVFAMLFLGAGFSNYEKTAQLRIRSLYNYNLHPDQLKITELPRVQELEQNLDILIYINICIVAASFFIFLYFKKKRGNEYYMGAAASLFLMAVISTVVYYIIIKSTDTYIAGIQQYTEKIIVNKKG
jgi:hypothetical protein